MQDSSQMNIQVDPHDQIAEYVAAFFGGSARGIVDKDTNTGTEVLILRSDNCPMEGVSSYSTVGLSDKTVEIDGKIFDFGVEICGASQTCFDSFVKLLGDIALNVKEGIWIAAEHTVFPDLIQKYYPHSEMKHVLMVTPGMWDEDFGDYTFDHKRVIWLMMVPISTAEFEYTLANGVYPLEDLFVDQQIDVFDLERRSVI